MVLAGRNSSRQFASATTTRKRGKETILIVEDDPFVRSHRDLRVEALGYRVTPPINGNEALQRLRDRIKVDMLFTDIVMPGGINGWELAEQRPAVSAWSARCC